MGKYGIDSYPVNYAGIHAGGKLTREERERLVRKLSRLLEWVGVWVPDEIYLDGKKVHLHDIVWNIINKKDMTDDDLEFLLSLEKKLNKKFQEDLANIKNKDTTEDQAIKDYGEAIGLLRAIVTLKDAEKKEEKKGDKDELLLRMRENTKDQAKYWLDFLKRLQR